MSQKKHKKRHSQPVLDAKRQAAQTQLAEDRLRRKNRLNPTARTLLLGDLVFLAVTELLYKGEMISEFVSGCMTLIGVVLLVLALWFQFGPGGRGGPKSAG